jgi:hypothetical protein
MQMLPHSPSPMSNAPLEDIVPLDGPTEFSARINLAIANAERRAIGLPPQERIEVALTQEVSKLASVVAFPSTPAETHKRDIDELFCSPGAHARSLELQLAESEAAEEIADRIAEVAHGAESAKALPAKERATVRFLGVHALRLTRPCWQDEAMQAAIQRCALWMREEGGKTFLGCSRAQIEHLAVSLAPWVVRAYLGISEGVTPLTPGKYLSIVDGGRK